MHNFHRGMNAPYSAYQPEIEGLRALAVVAVIINHFNKDILPGGYLGVDIFFIISGYVISLSMMNRITKNFSEFFMEFYVRRIKRLLPALVVCVVITSLIVCLVDPNPKISVKTGIASLFGLSNLYLLGQATDYFSPSAEMNVFTQTWSLGVEEQFYILFPFMVWFTGMKRFSTGLFNLYWIISALSLISLAGFIFLSQTNQPAAFFLMPTRFWELGAGCIVFLVLNSRGAHLTSAVSQGIRSVSFSSERGNFFTNFFLRKGTLAVFFAIIAIFFVPIQFSVYCTIFAVLLTMYLIGSMRPQTRVYAILTSSPVIYIGRLSYSLYLWHWSVLSISRWTIGIHWWSTPFQIGLMLIFAIISYKYIERPLRQAKWSSVNRLTIGYGLSASMGAALVCFVFLSNKTILILPSFVRPPDFLPLELSGLPYDPTCVVDGDKRPLKADTFDLCTVLPKIKNGKRIWALGDSHAGHLQGLLYSVYERAGLGVHLIETPGQSFPLSRGTKFEPRDIIFEQIKGNLHIGDIVLLSRLFLDRRNGKKVSDLSFWLEDVIRFARSLSLKGVSVVIVGPPPMFKFENINTCMSMWSGSSYCDVYRTSILADIKEVYDIIEESTKQQGNIYTFNQFEILCPESNVKCSPSRKGVFLFRDKDHLNSLGSASLSDHFMQFLHDNGLLDHSKINNTEEKS